MNGQFVYLRMGGWAVATSTDNPTIGAVYANTAVVIKKIRKFKSKGQELIYLVVGGGNISNYWLQIEEAIATCEVAACQNNQPETTTDKPDKYDQLKKLKELLDLEIVTQEEFDKEKRKILEGG